MKFIATQAAILSILLSSQVYTKVPSQEDTIVDRKRLDSLVSPMCLSIPEGGFVYYYHPAIKTWLEQRFNASILKGIETQLKDSLAIPLTKEGFTKAIGRPEGVVFGDISYTAVWVRDSCWHYYGMKIASPKNAAKLLLNLMKFYSSQEQFSRFLTIIEKPQLADPDLNPEAQMQVPLIRFSSKTLSHFQLDGKDEEWNHIQFDSHGLFMLALSDALTSGILTPAMLTTENFAMLALFPAFFSQTKYADKKDAGPWEDEMLYNASSAGLVASGLKRMMEMIRSNPALNKGLQGGIKLLKNKVRNPNLIGIIEQATSVQSIQRLYQEGMERVDKNLALGGEAPSLDGKSRDRRADAALLFLALLEYTPFYDQPEKIKMLLNIDSSLVGPYGIYRYKYDPYQSSNYWINFDIASAISGVKTAELDYLNSWHKGYMPHKQPFDAQWFFDSCFADLYYRLSMLEKGREMKAYYLRHGDIHLKRSLAQLSGPDSYAANGVKLDPLQSPESINTVIDFYYSVRPMHSPICPLNWAKAALQMALERAQAAHAQ